MNEQIRKTVKDAVERLPISQAELARQLDLSPKVLNRALNQQGKTPEVWEALLGALGLELVVVRQRERSPHGSRSTVDPERLRRAVETLRAVQFAGNPAKNETWVTDYSGEEPRTIGKLKLELGGAGTEAEATTILDALTTCIHSAYELHLALNGELNLPTLED